jgi:hypothetical protein
MRWAGLDGATEVRRRTETAHGNGGNGIKKTYGGEGWQKGEEQLGYIRKSSEAVGDRAEGFGNDAYGRVHLYVYT